MISIIYGAKGSGKTKKIIDKANANLETTKGEIVFLAATNRYRMEIKQQIRFINTNEAGISNKDGLIGFVKGLLSANYDISSIYIDGMYKMMQADMDSAEIAEFMLQLDTLANSVEFTLTASCDKESLPKLFQKYHLI